MCATAIDHRRPRSAGVTTDPPALSSSRRSIAEVAVRRGRDLKSFGEIAAIRVGTPGFLTHEPNTSMPNYNLVYAISKRTPPTPKTLKSILDAQAELNRRCTWTHERLSLAPERQAIRAPFALPFTRIIPSSPLPAAYGERRIMADLTAKIPEACAAGSTKVRDNLWNAHLVVAFLRSVSADHPELLLELRDDGGFVLPGAVWIHGGKVELQRQWLNAERERVLERTGDPQAAAPFLWAESEALEGRFFQEAEASECSEVREIQEVGLTWEQLQVMSLQEVAELVVDRVTTPTVKVLA